MEKKTERRVRGYEDLEVYRNAHQAMLRCEGFAPGAAPAPVREQPTLEALPSLAEDRARIEDARPNRLGVSFAQAPGHPRGAALVRAVAPGSAASVAGLRPGDVILGAPGEPFAVEMDLKRWVLTAPRAQPLPLEVQRGRARLVVEVVLRAW